MKKTLFALLSALVLASMILSACGSAETPAPEAPAAAEAPPESSVKKIAFFVSDLSNVFHQAQAAEAKKYAMEKYGAEVYVFDGKADSATMTSNIDQVVAQGMDAATLHIWDQEAAKPGVEAALAKGIIMTSFFSPIADTGIPTARSDEKGVSFAMGVEMANQWKAAFPDKPIVMVELGWPNHTEVKSGRTDPWVQGVLSVDSDGNRPGLPGCKRGRRSGQASDDGPGNPAPRSQPDLCRSRGSGDRLNGGTDAGRPWQDGQRQTVDRDCRRRRL